MTLNLMTGELTEESSMLDDLHSMNEEQVADLILDAGEELKQSLDEEFRRNHNEGGQQ